MSFDLLGVVGLNVLFFCFGWVFFSRVLYREYEVRSIVGVCSPGAVVVRLLRD